LGAALLRQAAVRWRPIDESNPRRVLFTVDIEVNFSLALSAKTSAKV